MDIENVNLDANGVRFSSAPWANDIRNINVTIAGVGGIGSWTSLLISRLNPNHISLFDPDKIESVNMSGQLFNSQQVEYSEYKVHACANNIRNLSNYNNIVTSASFFRDLDYYNIKHVFICGFDNMEARKTAFEAWKKRISTGLESNRCKYVFIDGRLNAEEFQILCLTGDNEYLINKYEEEYLFDSSEAESNICSYKQTSHIAAMIASFITNLVVNHVVNVKEEMYIRKLPFFTYYNGLSMKLITED